jgi:HPt (histidine-containing phosphotransfer) domain-containing protein
MSSKYSHIDLQLLEGLLELSDPGEPSIVGELLEIFEATTPDLLKALSQSISNNELQKVYAGAHRLKGSASNIGASVLATTLLEIEQQAKSGEGPINPLLFDSAVSLFNQSCAEIHAWLKENIT